MVVYVWQLLREVKGRRSAAWTCPWRSIFLIFGWVEWAGTGPPGQGSNYFFSPLSPFSSNFFVILRFFSLLLSFDSPFLRLRSVHGFPCFYITFLNLPTFG